MTLILNLIATSVGRPAYLGDWQGEHVTSGIRKTPLTDPTVAVSPTNIAGDQQADLTVHGGIDRVAYVYSADHWWWWKEEANFDAKPASFGENLTVSGADEQQVRIGDRFLWGPVLLEVNSPRGPCHKFALLTERSDMGPRMTASARTGWYCRAIETGIAPTVGALVRVLTDEAMPSVAETFIAAYQARSPIALLDKVITAPALNEEWRSSLIEKRKRKLENGPASTA